MRIYLIACLTLCIITLIIIAAAYVEHKRNQAEILRLKAEVVKLRKYTHYQQSQIENLREHNGNLYDENNGLKRTMALNNIPDFPR